MTAVVDVVSRSEDVDVGEADEPLRREVCVLRGLRDRLRVDHSLTERESIRRRTQLTHGVMLYVTDIVDTQSESWRELGTLTHQILVETADVERFRKRRTWG